MMAITKNPKAVVTYTNDRRIPKTNCINYLGAAVTILHYESESQAVSAFICSPQLFISRTRLQPGSQQK